MPRYSGAIYRLVDDDNDDNDDDDHHEDDDDHHDDDGDDDDEVKIGQTEWEQGSISGPLACQTTTPTSHT